MDLLLLIVLVLVLLSVGGWGYGTYGYRTVPAAGDVVAAPVAPGWTTPLGLLGMLLLVGLLAMLFTGWRPFVLAV